MKFEERTKAYLNVVCKTGIGQKAAHQDREHLTFLCLMVLGNFDALQCCNNSFEFIFLSVDLRSAKLTSLPRLTVLSFSDKPELIVRSHKLVLELLKVSK